MSDDVIRWQSDAQHCFGWLSKMYDQAQVLWSDAEAMFQEEGWDIQVGSGFGGIAMSSSDLSNWPFAYFKAKTMKPDPGIETVRRARELISQEVGHDPTKLVERYIEMQKRFQERMLPNPSEEEQQTTNEAAE